MRLSRVAESSHVEASRPQGGPHQLAGISG
jgi:hypothetical protein